MKKIFFKFPIWVISLFISIIISIYWLYVATPRYVSEAHIVLQTPDIAPPQLSFASLVSGAAASSTADLKLLQDYLLSVDALKLLDQELNLRDHFSEPSIDYFSRMSKSDLPMEKFHNYYQKRINIELDDYAGVLVVKSSAFTSEMAKKITDKLLKLGEFHMNQMGQDLASGQVNFIEIQVHKLSHNLETTGKALLDYQDAHGLISPSGTVETYAAIIAQLKGQLAGLHAKFSMISKYQSPKSTEVVLLQSEIESLERQIEIENSKLTATTGNALNKVSAEYTALQLKAKFAQDLYSNSLATLEATRVEAARKLKQISVTQSATIPEYPIEPYRVYNIVVTILILFLLTVILSMIYEIIRDRSD